MKKLKRVISTVLMTCLLCSCFSVAAFAASAELRFSDPSTTVGAEFEVTSKLKADTGVKTVEAELKYDEKSLKFIGGSNATGEAGKIKLSATGEGNSDTVEFDLKFQALEEGTTKIEIESADVASAAGEKIEVTRGSSSVTIGPGDPSLIKEDAVVADGPEVEVNGKKLTVAKDFPTEDLPQGFVKEETEYEGEKYNVAMQQGGNIQLAYLVDGEEKGDFYLYNEDNATFGPFEEVEIGEGRYFIFLDVAGQKLPKQYQKTSLLIENEGKEFSVWQDTKNPEYYLVYGINSDGDKMFYTYDSVDGTYQRAQIDQTPEKKSPKSMLGDFGEKIADYLDVFVIAVAVVVVLLLIILLVTSIKLRHRNLELDDLYDEYGIDLDEEEEIEEKPKKSKKKEKKSKKKSRRKDDDFDDYDDFDDDDYEDYDESDEVFEGYKEYNADDFSADGEIDDLDELLNARVRKPAERPQPQPQPQPKTDARRGHMEDDDTFKMDIIDLD